MARLFFFEIIMIGGEVSGCGGCSPVPDQNFELHRKDQTHCNLTMKLHESKLGTESRLSDTLRSCV